MKPRRAVALPALLALSLALVPACEDKKTTPPGTSGTATAPSGHDAGHGGAVVELGSATIGSFDVKATRDEGRIAVGGDAPIDATVTPAAGSGAKATAVRFWIGTEDAKGSIKARAEVENPAEPAHWHAHAEVPSSLPQGARLWVEIEDDKGTTSVGSFDLKAG